MNRLRKKVRLEGGEVKRRETARRIWDGSQIALLAGFVRLYGIRQWLRLFLCERMFVSD
jgi:hypothetical protein